MAMQKAKGFGGGKLKLTLEALENAKEVSGAKSALSSKFASGYSNAQLRIEQKQIERLGPKVDLSMFPKIKLLAEERMAQAA
jgi:hypothetical protein